MFMYATVGVPLNATLLALWTHFETWVMEVSKKIILSIEMANAKKEEWKKLRDLCGGAYELSIYLNEPQRTVEHWIYDPYQDVPYQYAVLAWLKFPFDISLAALAPDKFRTNNALLIDYPNLINEQIYQGIQRLTKYKEAQHEYTH